MMKGPLFSTPSGPQGLLLAPSLPPPRPCPILGHLKGNWDLSRSNALRNTCFDLCAKNGIISAEAPFIPEWEIKGPWRERLAREHFGVEECLPTGGQTSAEEGTGVVIKCTSWTKGVGHWREDGLQGAGKRGQRRKTTATYAIS